MQYPPSVLPLLYWSPPQCKERSVPLFQWKYWLLFLCLKLYRCFAWNTNALGHLHCCNYWKFVEVTYQPFYCEMPGIFQKIHPDIMTCYLKQPIYSSTNQEKPQYKPIILHNWTSVPYTENRMSYSFLCACIPHCTGFYIHRLHYTQVSTIYMFQYVITLLLALGKIYIWVRWNTIHYSWINCLFLI